MRAPDLENLRALIEAGKVTPVVDRTYPLTEAATAIGQMRSPNVRGKLVVAVRAQQK